MKIGWIVVDDWRSDILHEIVEVFRKGVASSRR